ncbi:MAG: integrase core domain-containing protein [Planctomycetota bacterium]
MPDLFPLRLLLATFGGWVNRHQADAIAYLIEENRVLKEQLGGRRPRLTDDQRRRLAAKGQRLGRPALFRIATIVTPDTILRWHRRLITLKHTFPSRRVGRPGLMQEIRALIARMAEDNPRWGYCRIQGELKKVGHRVARSTIAKTLKDHGVPPTNRRTTSWRTFLSAHEDAIAATDFFTTEVWTRRGLVTHYVLFVIDHATRAVEIVGCTTRPDAAFMAQIARNLTDLEDGALRRKRFLVLDRDSKFTAQFHRILGDAGVTTVRTAFQAPNMNAIAERFIGSLKRECLDQLILFGEDHLRRVLREYVAHYNTERPHQGIGNEPITRRVDGSANSGPIVEHERLDGLLRSYSRAA